MRKLRHGTSLGPKLESELRCTPRLSGYSWTLLPVTLILPGPPLAPWPGLEGVVTATHCFSREVFAGDLETNPVHRPLPHWPWTPPISVKGRDLSRPTLPWRATWGSWPWRRKRRRSSGGVRSPRQKPWKTLALGACTWTPRTARPFRVQLWGWKGLSPSAGGWCELCCFWPGLLGGRETALALVRVVPSALLSHLVAFLTWVTFPRVPGAQLHSPPGFLRLWLLCQRSVASGQVGPCDLLPPLGSALCRGPVFWRV